MDVERVGHVLGLVPLVLVAAVLGGARVLAFQPRNTSEVGIYKIKKEISLILKILRSCFLPFFLGQDLVFFLFSSI